MGLFGRSRDKDLPGCRDGRLDGVPRGQRHWIAVDHHNAELIAREAAGKGRRRRG